MSSKAVLALCLLTTATPASAVEPLRHPVRFFRDHRAYNRRVDRGEQLGLNEFRTYQKSDLLPARVAPSRVLEHKMERLRGQLERLRSGVAKLKGAGESATLDTVLGPHEATSALNESLRDTVRYAHTRQVPLDEALVMRWAGEAAGLTTNVPRFRTNGSSKYRDGMLEVHEKNTDTFHKLFTLYSRDANRLRTLLAQP
jgi:hypothetical protein